MKKRSNVVIESMISLNTSLEKLKFGDKLVPKVTTNNYWISIIQNNSISNYRLTNELK